MIVLGIECTAHTFSIGIEEDGIILANVIDTFFSGSNGFIPRELADHHAEVFSKVLEKSLSIAKITMDDIDLIAFSQGPGIGAPLSVGIAGAKFLSTYYNKEIIGVNHPFAHIEISKHMTGFHDPLILYLSGGNSQIIIEKKGYYYVIGETLDIGIGNLFDSFAREIKLEHAHGKALADFSKDGNYVNLPYTVKGMNLVFSGLLSAASKIENKKDAGFSLMETSFAMTCEVTERALFLTKKKALITCGGVAQNRRLQEMLKTMCKEDGALFGVAQDEFNRDNGAMIAYAGSIQYKRFGPMKINDCIPITNYRIDKMRDILG